MVIKQVKTLAQFIEASKKQNGPRVLGLDIETFPMLGYFFDIWDQNIGLEQIKEDWSLMSVACKWLGQPEVYYRDQSGMKNMRNDKELLKDVHMILSNTDMMIAHNGKKFDLRKLKARMAINDMEPLPQIKVIDTLQLNRQAFGFTSQKLQYVSAQFAVKAKYEHKAFPGFKLWSACMADDPKAWKECRIYNIQDVTSMEESYMKVRGWYQSTPNFGAYAKIADGDVTTRVCPNCGGTHMQSRGTRMTNTGIYTRYQCMDCKTWPRSRKMLVPAKQRQHILIN